MLIPDCDAELQADFSFLLIFCNLRTGLLHLVAYNSPFKFLWVFRVWRFFKFILWYLWCLQPQFCFWFYDLFFFKSTLSKPLSTFPLFLFVHGPYSFVEPEMLKPNKSKPEMWRMSQLFFSLWEKMSCFTDSIPRISCFAFNLYITMITSSQKFIPYLSSG